MEIDGTPYKISDEFLSLESFYDAKVASLGQVRVSCPATEGGFAQPVYGKLEVLPDIIDGIMPVSCPIIVSFTDTTEAAAVILFEGTAHRTSSPRESYVYQLYAVDEGTVTTGNISWNDTLVDIFSDECNTGDLSALTLDSTYARSPSPPVIYSTTSEREVLDALSDVAKFHSHCFTIEDGVLYLIDMKEDRGTAKVITEFDFFPATYKDGPAYSLFESEDTTVDGSYAYGSEKNISPVAATEGSSPNDFVTQALTNIKAIYELARVQLPLPITVDPPLIGQRVEWIDDSHHISLDVWMRCRSLIYDFDKSEVVMEGEGEVNEL